MEALDVLDERAQIEEIVKRSSGACAPCECRREASSVVQASEHTVQQHLAEAVRRFAHVIFGSPRRELPDNGTFGRMHPDSTIYDDNS
jgi:hypothetical protein